MKMFFFFFCFFEFKSTRLLYLKSMVIPNICFCFYLLRFIFLLLKKLYLFKKLQGFFFIFSFLFYCKLEVKEVKDGFLISMYSLVRQICWNRYSSICCKAWKSIVWEIVLTTLHIESLKDERITVYIAVEINLVRYITATI